MSPTPKPKDQAMPDAEHAALNTYLQTRGFAAADAAIAIGATPAGRTRDDVARALATWLKARPKA